ncbi:MAG: glycosyltransferase [Anaerolineales bacterium]|nr:glycosyltransferase [Anaerolineales bacterium]
MASIRVVRVIARMNIGGPAIHVGKLASGLARNGFDTILVAGRPGAAEGDMSDLALENGVNFQILKQLGPRISPWDDGIALFRLLQLMRCTTPEIVHTHTSKAGVLGRLAARLAGVPVVVHTFHGHVFSDYWGPVMSKVPVVIERLMARLTTVIVTVSETVRSELVAHRIAPAEKIHVLPLGLELEVFMSCAARRGEFRTELGIDGNVPLVGTVGRMVSIKNQQLFLRAASRLVTDGFSGRFVIVGGGELAGDLRQLARELGIADRTVFTGWRRDLDKIYADLDVLVNTANNEGTPVALIEAMAARVPVVATAVGGVPDMIKSEHSGFLVATGDLDALVDAIERALIAPAALLDAAQNYVLETHSLDRMLTGAASLYRRLLQEK